VKLVAAILKPFRMRAMRAGFVPTSARDAGVDPRTSEQPPTAARERPPVDGVSRWLFPQVVLLDSDVRDKREVLDLAATTLKRFHGVDAALVARALWRREAAVGTGLGEGVAVPHARVEGIAEPVTLLIRTRRPIPYGAPDRKPVSQLFAIVVPDDGDANEHLRLLANVAELFSQPAFRERIAAANDTRAVQRAFEEYAEAISDAERASARRIPSRPG
jgi:PTS system nitrogen regulatory IIA component